MNFWRNNWRSVIDVVKRLGFWLNQDLKQKSKFCWLCYNGLQKWGHASNEVQYTVPLQRVPCINSRTADAQFRPLQVIHFQTIFFSYIIQHLNLKAFCNWRCIGIWRKPSYTFCLQNLVFRYQEKIWFWKKLTFKATF